MAVIQSVLAFIVAIGILVTIHEFGHYWVARRLGVKVLRFSVGFGRTLISRRFGDDQVEFVVAAIPLGGYVKMLDEREGDVSAEDLPRAFNRQSLSVRSAVAAAGPVANFLFAIFAYWVMFLLGVSGEKAIIEAIEPDSPAALAGLVAGDRIVGVGGREALTLNAVVQGIINEKLDAGDIVIRIEKPGGAVVDRRLNLSAFGVDDLTQGRFLEVVGLTPKRIVPEAVIGKLTSGDPAERAGFLEGDRVVSADGVAINDWGDWVKFVRARPEQTFQVQIERKGRARSLTLRPNAVPDGEDTIGRIGAGPLRTEAFDRALEQHSVTERYGVWTSLTQATQKTYDMSAMTLTVFWRMLQLEVSVKNLSGPISIAQYAGYSAHGGIAKFLEFLAIVSLSLGILNLLPIPVLDGGHLLYNAMEFLKGGPISDQTQLVGQQLGIALLVGLMSLAFYNDIARLFG